MSSFVPVALQAPSRGVIVARQCYDFEKNKKFKPGFGLPSLTLIRSYRQLVAYAQIVVTAVLAGSVSFDTRKRDHAAVCSLAPNSALL